MQSNNVEVKKGGNVDYLITQIKKATKEKRFAVARSNKKLLNNQNKRRKKIWKQKKENSVLRENYFTRAGRQVESCAISHTVRGCVNKELTFTSFGRVRMLDFPSGTM